MSGKNYVIQLYFYVVCEPYTMTDRVKEILCSLCVKAALNIYL